jgi:hypothetical protein
MSSSNEVDFVTRGVQHPNPLFDYMTTFVPRRLKSLFHYCEYLYFNCPQVFAALTKFAIYPITDFVYETESEVLKKKYQRWVEKVLKLKTTLLQTGVDKHVYGNSFISMYFPFRRFLVCPECKMKYNIRFVEYKFKIHQKELYFTFRCEKCDKTVRGEVEDVKLRMPSPRDIHVIRWDPKCIEIDGNPITGDREFYYEIPSVIKQQVKDGNNHLLATMPMAFLKTIAQDKLFKFAKGKIFFMRTEGPSGVDNDWGFPPLLSTLKQFMYVSSLRKANEAIALEYLMPFRVLHPAQATAAGDPTITISLNNWINETKMNLQAWRRDPLHLMFSPIPLGVTTLGGQGRALMVTGEIVEAENSIIASMGIPREFLYGGLSATGSGVTLRMLENQLLNYTTQLMEQAQWVLDKSAEFLGWKKIQISLEPFKLVDDVQQKSLLFQANQMTGGTLLSPTSMGSLLGRDATKERGLRKQDALNEERYNFELQQEIQKLRENLSTRAQASTQADQPQGYDQQQIIAQADTIVQQLMTMDDSTRKSYLHSLQVEDIVMYSVVVQRWEEMQTQQRAQIREQMNQQMAQGGMPMVGSAPPPAGMPMSGGGMGGGAGQMGGM